MTHYKSRFLNILGLYLIVAIILAASYLTGRYTAQLSTTPTGRDPSVLIQSADSGSYVFLHDRQPLILSFSNMDEWGVPVITGSLHQTSDREFVFAAPYQAGTLSLTVRNCHTSSGACTFTVAYFASEKISPFITIPQGARLITPHGPAYPACPDASGKMCNTGTKPVNLPN